MLKVTVEIYPHGLKSLRQTLGTMIIVNNGKNKDGPTYGDYDIDIDIDGESVSVVGHERDEGFWPLIRKAIAEAEISRIEGDAACCDKYETELFRRGAMLDAPCFVCGYNGEGYFNPDKHECAKKHHEFFHNDDGGEG